MVHQVPLGRWGAGEAGGIRETEGLGSSSWILSSPWGKGDTRPILARKTHTPEAGVPTSQPGLQQVLLPGIPVCWSCPLLSRDVKEGREPRVDDKAISKLCDSFCSWDIGPVERGNRPQDLEMFGQAGPLHS